MTARPHCVLVVLLLAGLSRFAVGNSNPGFVARITKKGLEYGKVTGLVLMMPFLAYHSTEIMKTVCDRLW